jgi:hypothetical protein
MAMPPSSYGKPKPVKQDRRMSAASTATDSEPLQYEHNSTALALLLPSLLSILWRHESPIILQTLLILGLILYALDMVNARDALAIVAWISALVMTMVSGFATLLQVDDSEATGGAMILYLIRLAVEGLFFCTMVGGDIHVDIVDTFGRAWLNRLCFLTFYFLKFIAVMLVQSSIFLVAPRGSLGRQKHGKIPAFNAATHILISSFLSYCTAAHGLLGNRSSGYLFTTFVCTVNDGWNVDVGLHAKLICSTLTRRIIADAVVLNQFVGGSGSFDASFDSAWYDSFAHVPAKNP